MFACCGCTAGEPELAGPAPTKATEADEEDNIQLSSTGVVKEPLQLHSLEVGTPSIPETSQTDFESAELREKFGTRVVSSVSLQGLNVDENPELAQRASLRAGTTNSLNSMASKRSKKSIVSRISGVFRKAKRPDFNGRWVCISTYGLDDFLKEMGISYVKRLAASKAPWPSWEFQQDQDKFSFCNHTMMGDIKEDFEANGSPYNAVDGHKQTLQCVLRADLWFLLCKECSTATAYILSRATCHPCH